MLLDNLKLFLRIVEKGGMASAGREFGLSPAAVTDRLSSLEAYYGASLLNRTTRSISLTDEGKELMVGAHRILAEAEELQSRIKFGVENISGSIRISAPIDLGRNRVAVVLDTLLKNNPELKVELILSDGYVDLVRENIDLALRYGDLADSTLKSKKLGDNRRLVCASPDYLKLHGTPQHPDDLQNHNCILMRFGSEIDRDWRFVIAKKIKRYSITGNRIANDGSLVREWCLAGHGVALKSEWDIHADLKSGKLIPILEDYLPSPTSLQMVYPAASTQPRRVRLLMEQLVQSFSG